MYLSRLSTLLLFMVPNLFGATLTIETAINQFVKNNFDLQIARQEVDKSKADLTTAQLHPNPILSGSYNSLDVMHHLSDTSAASAASTILHIDYPIELGGKRAHRIETANEGISYANVLFEETKRKQFFTLINAYYQVQADEADLTNAIANSHDFRDLLVIAQAKLDHGFLSQMDFEKLQLQAIDYENDVNAYKAALSSDMEALAFLLSMNVKDVTLSPLVLPEDFSKSVDELILNAQQNRSDCLAAQQNIKVANASVELEKANSIPDLTLGIEMENYAPTYSNPLVGISVAIPLPIYDRNQGAIQKARITTLQAATQKSKILYQAASEVRQAYIHYQSQLDIYASMQRGFESARKLKEKQEKIFAFKGISILELLDAQKSYREYQTNMTKSIVELHIALANLKLYSGLPLIDSKGY